MNSNRSTAEIIRAEEKYLLSKTLTDLRPADQALYLALMNEYSAKRAEILALKNDDTSELLKLRALLFRGRFSEGEQLLKELKSQAVLPQEIVEVLHEEIRFAAFDGNWLLAASLVDNVLKLNPSLVTVMTLLQIRALSQYEIGNVSEALQDIDRVDSFRHLFPDSEACLYTETLKARIYGKRGDSHFGIQILRRLWDKYIAGGLLNQNHVLTLLRTEIVLRKQLQTSAINHAIACVNIAQLMGDSLYAALAQLDCAFLSPRDLSESLIKQIAIDAKKFNRVQRLIEESTSSSEDISMTAYHLRNCQTHSEAISKIDLDRHLHSTLLLFPTLGIQISIDPWQVTGLELRPQTKKALITLGGGKISKTSYFRQLWGNQKYVPTLHDPLIWNSLTRIRRQLDPSGKTVRIELAESEIHCHGMLILEI